METPGSAPFCPPDSSRSTQTRSYLWQGTRDSAPFLLVIAPFALLFGVVATEAGLTVTQTIGFSFLVIAGASQFTAIQLMTEIAPVVIVWDALQDFREREVVAARESEVAR